MNNWTGDEHPPWIVRGREITHVDPALLAADPDEVLLAWWDIALWVTLVVCGSAVGIFVSMLISIH